MMQFSIVVLSTAYGGWFIDAGFEEVILPEIWEQQTFIDKAGPEIVNQMWAFNDKGNRPVCLIPEVTGLIQQLYRDEWSKQRKEPMRIFYVNRCYRYERPQKGRYREFTQFGVELLGGDCSTDKDEVVALLRRCLDATGVEYKFSDTVKRGLTYYVEDGFEAEAPALGSQKQIAGGGRYDVGIGWAIGVDRLRIAL